MPISDHARASDQLGELEFVHTFVIVAKLVALGIELIFYIRRDWC